MKTAGIVHGNTAIHILQRFAGIIGCVPAYDRYFIEGVKNQKVAIGKYGIDSVMQLVDFYKHNEEQLEKIRMKMKIEDITYPQMKILDMGFWQIGFNLDMKKKMNNTHQKVT